jgi:hypothetical protein
MPKGLQEVFPANRFEQKSNKNGSEAYLKNKTQLLPPMTFRLL